MNRSIQVRFAAFAASLLVTFAVVDSIAVYAYAPPADAIAHAGTPSLAKPFDERDLIAAITRAVSASHESAF